MMTEGLSAGGGLGSGVRGEGGETQLTLMEGQGPGEWGWEPGLLEWLRFTVRGERPGVGGRTGRLLWGDKVRSWEERFWGWGGLLVSILAVTPLVSQRVWVLCDENPEFTEHICTFGGDWLLEWWSLLKVPDDCMVPELELLSPPLVHCCCSSSSFRSMYEVKWSICCTT